MRCATIDGLAIHKGAVRGGCNRVGVVGITVIEVSVAPPADDVGVADERVVDVDVVPIAAASVVPGMEGLTPAEREPRMESESKPKPEPAAEESDEGRTIEWPPIQRTGAPTPTPAKPVPAAIVVRGKTPGLVANPSPTPRTNPVPVTVAVGSPVRANRVRSPDRTVVGLFAPRAVLVQVAVANRIARNVFGGWRVVFLQVTILRPAIQIIRGWRSGGREFYVVVRTRDVGALTGVNRIRLPARGNFTLAADGGDAGIVTVLIDVDAEIARLANGERKIGRVHFVVIALKNFTNAEVELAFGEAYLGDVLIEIQERDGGHAAEMQGGLSCLQFRAGVLIHPKFVANGHGAILGGRAPIAGAARLQRDGTIGKADAGNARWRIVGVIGTWADIA